MSDTGPALALRDVKVRSANGRVLLDISALDLAPASAMVVTGPSGAGKSTLLSVLAGLAVPAEGSVCWDRTDLATLTPRARAAFRRTAIGLVFQEHLLIDQLDPMGNAAIAADFAPGAERSAIRRRASEALVRLGVPIDRPTVATLSGGERQRVALARALACAPRILLADEPTASLDRQTADRLIDDLIAVVTEQGTTLIVASHDPVLIARLPSRLTLEDGRVVA